jgi:serine/threonine protein kinase
LETIPLKEGRYLGQGSFGDVYETFCKNLPVARKRVHFKNQVKIKDVKKEVEILQKLSHHHIINLLGSFTQNRMLGLLLLPVADCELGEFLEAIDQTPSDEHPNEICVILGLDAAAKHTGQPLDPVLRLRPLMGCIANAIEYLHKNRIRHKGMALEC